MKLNKKELKTLGNIMLLCIIKESERYSDTAIYKQSPSYKEKSKLYAKIQSEYFGNEMTINEESIFGLLDLE